MPTGKRPRPPKGTRWIAQIFDKEILKEPGGVVFRKVTSVERHASEALLLHMASARGFEVTLSGTHYQIHRPGVTFVRLV